MRAAKPHGRARVQLTVTVDIPHESPLHYYERINDASINTHYSAAALRAALDPDNDEFYFVGATRSRWVEDRTPDASTADTDSASTTDASEDHSSASAGDPDPSDSDTEDAPSAAAWDFVVA